MNAPVLSYNFPVAKPSRFADLSLVRTLSTVVTDDEETVPAGTRGTIVAVWGDGEAYEVEFEAGVATVEATLLVAA